MTIPPLDCTYVFGLRPRDHVTSALRELHWLPIAQRIECKLHVPACPQVDRRSSASVYEKPPDCRRRCSIGVSASWSYKGELCRTEDSPQARGKGVFRWCSTSVESSSNRPQNVAFYSCIFKRSLKTFLFWTAYMLFVLSHKRLNFITYTPILKSFHWLKMNERIKYNINSKLVNLLTIVLLSFIPFTSLYSVFLSYHP